MSQCSWAQSLYCGAGHPLFDLPHSEIGQDRIREATWAGRGYLEESRPLELVPKATSHSMEGLAILVLSGRFIAYLPRHYAAQWERMGRMREIEPDRLTPPVLFPRGHPQGEGHKARALTDFLADLKAAHPPFRPRRNRPPNRAGPRSNAPSLRRGDGAQRARMGAALAEGASRRQILVRCVAEGKKPLAKWIPGQER